MQVREQGRTSRAMPSLHTPWDWLQRAGLQISMRILCRKAAFNLTQSQIRNVLVLLWLQAHSGPQGRVTRAGMMM